MSKEDKIINSAGTRIGFFEMYNSRKRCVFIKDVPFDFNSGPTLYQPDDDLSGFGEFEVLDPDDGINKPNVEPINPDDYEWPPIEGEELTPGEGEDENEGIMLFSALVGDELLAPPFDIVINTYHEETESYDGVPVYSTLGDTSSLIEYIGNTGEITLTVEQVETVQEATGEKWGKVTITQEENSYEGWISLDNEYVTIKQSAAVEDPEPVEPEPAQLFVDWFREYFYKKLVPNCKFMSHFTTGKVYILILQDRKDIMGLMTVRKGMTILVMNQPGEPIDMVELINKMYPKIRKDLILKDDSFGGYDDDSQHTLYPDPLDQSFGGYGNDDEYMFGGSEVSEPIEPENPGDLGEFDENK